MSIKVLILHAGHDHISDLVYSLRAYEVFDVIDIQQLKEEVINDHMLITFLENVNPVISKTWRVIVVPNPSMKGVGEDTANTFLRAAFERQSEGVVQGVIPVLLEDTDFTDLPQQLQSFPSHDLVKAWDPVNEIWDLEALKDQLLFWWRN